MKKSNYLFGIILIVIGIVFGLNSFGIAKINIFFRGWWTLFIIIPSLIGLINDQDKTGNIVGLIIGLLLFLAVNNIIDFDFLWKIIVPLILVTIGLSIILKDRLKNKIEREITNSNSDEEYYATFGSSHIDITDEKFKGCSLNATFGELICDISSITLKENTKINISSVFGTIKIISPKDTIIKVNSTPIFGKIENSKRSSDDKKNKILYIEGLCIFGGVEIK